MLESLMETSVHRILLYFLSFLSTLHSHWFMFCFVFDVQGPEGPEGALGKAGQQVSEIL